MQSLTIWKASTRQMFSTLTPCAYEEVLSWEPLAEAYWVVVIARLIGELIDATTDADPAWCDQMLGLIRLALDLKREGP